MDLKKLIEYAKQQQQADNSAEEMSGANYKDPEANDENPEIFVPLDDGDELEPIPDIVEEFSLSNESLSDGKNRHLKELKISEKIQIIKIAGTDYAEDLGVPPEQAAVYARLNALIPEFLNMLDDNALELPEAEMLASLKQTSQQLVYQTIISHELKLTADGAAELAKAKRLTEDSIIKTLKPKPAPKITIPAEIADRYFQGKTVTEAVEIIESALQVYLGA